MDGLATIPVFAAAIGRSQHTVERWIRSGELHVVPIRRITVRGRRPITR